MDPGWGWCHHHQCVFVNEALDLEQVHYHYHYYYYYYYQFGIEALVQELGRY